MPWMNKERIAPTTLTGAWYLDGDLVTKIHHAPHSADKTFPLIAFPSGLYCELVQLEQNDAIRLFDNLILPLHFAQTDETLVKQISLPSSAYAMQPVSSYQIDLWKVGYGGCYRIMLDQSKRTIADLSYLPGEPLVKSVPRPMELLDARSKAYLPPLYAQENKGLQAIAPIKFFTPDSQWTWYASEFDGKDLFFGLVAGWETELGYFSLAELEAIRGPLGLTLERDLYYQPSTLQALKVAHDR